MFGGSPDCELMFESYPCHIIKSKVSYNNIQEAYGFHRDSSYIELFNHHLMKIFDGGLDTERNITSNEGIDCMGSSAKYFRTLSYEDVISVFGVLFLGCFVAFIYSGIECLYKANPNRRV